jgi:hypothetical protein
MQNRAQVVIEVTKKGNEKENRETLAGRGFQCKSILTYPVLPL